MFCGPLVWKRQQVSKICPTEEQKNTVCLPWSSSQLFGDFPFVASCMKQDTHDCLWRGCARALDTSGIHTRQWRRQSSLPLILTPSSHASDLNTNGYASFKQIWEVLSFVLVFSWLVEVSSCNHHCLARHHVRQTLIVLQFTMKLYHILMYCHHKWHEEIG